MAGLLVNIENQEQQNAVSKKDTQPKKKTVNKLFSNDGEKDKQISAKVNNRTWASFTQINKAQGLSNNSALNMLINRYVRENRGILEE